METLTFWYKAIVGGAILLLYLSGTIAFINIISKTYRKSGYIEWGYVWMVICMIFVAIYIFANVPNGTF
jgi:lipid-A-disaccharide synthase-like uncharacterized protein